MDGRSPNGLLTYALSKANGNKEAIVDAEKLNLTGNHFYFTLLGELHKGSDDKKALGYFQKALDWQRRKQTNKPSKRKLKGCSPLI